MTGTRPMLMVVQQVVPLKPITNVLAGLSLAKTFASPNVASEKSWILKIATMETQQMAMGAVQAASLRMGTRQVAMGAHLLAKWSPVLDAMA